MNSLFNLIGLNTVYEKIANSNKKNPKKCNTVRCFVDCFAPEYLPVNDANLNFSLRIGECGSGVCMYMKNRTNKKIFVRNVVFKHPFACDENNECRGFADLVRYARVPGDTTVLALPIQFEPDEEKKMIDITNDGWKYKIDKYMSAGVKFEDNTTD